MSQVSQSPKLSPEDLEALASEKQSRRARDKDHDKCYFCQSALAKPYVYDSNPDVCRACFRRMVELAVSSELGYDSFMEIPYTVHNYEDVLGQGLSDKLSEKLRIARSHQRQKGRHLGRELEHADLASEHRTTLPGRGCLFNLPKFPRINARCNVSHASLRRGH